MAKGMGKGAKSKGFMGGGKSNGFVNTPMNAPKKGFKGKVAATSSFDLYNSELAARPASRTA